MVNLLHDPVFLSKAENRNQSVALELSDDDYVLLTRPEFWDVPLKFRDFLGYRHWRKSNTKNAIATQNIYGGPVWNSWL